MIKWKRGLSGPNFANVHTYIVNKDMIQFSLGKIVKLMSIRVIKFKSRQLNKKYFIYLCR